MRRGVGLLKNQLNKRLVQGNVGSSLFRRVASLMYVGLTSFASDANHQPARHSANAQIQPHIETLFERKN